MGKIYTMLFTEKHTNIQEQQDYTTIQLITWLFRKNGGIISWLCLLWNYEETMNYILYAFKQNMHTQVPPSSKFYF